MTEFGKPPDKGEFEFTLLGPGYGESIVLHVGEGVWILVDSCVGNDGTPRALQYLESIGVDPAEAVRLIVATHWHDDHIRGIANLVEVCSRATFCCASVLCKKEFLTVADALERRRPSFTSSGLREIHNVISRLAQTKSSPKLALADRRLFVEGKCEIWSLSPSDQVFQGFLRSISRLVIDRGGRGELRLPDLSPNNVAIALWVRVDDVTLLLGSDLEKRGWLEILESRERPTARASVFKIPHHGSESAYASEVWEHMLDSDPTAVLTPWRRGGHSVPNQREVGLILSHTSKAYVTAQSSSSKRGASTRSSAVTRTIRGSGVKLRQLAMSPGVVRLRYPLRSRMRLSIETFGAACHLKDFTQQ